MDFSLEFADDTTEYQARIKVVGCGGAGGNAINTMMGFGLEGVEFIALNTDAQALNRNLAAVKIGIGSHVTRGLGAGAKPDQGRKAAEEDLPRIKEALEGADMVFVTAGMGGGTGTGAAPVVARLAREAGALTVGVVTKPFLFEGRKRAVSAEHGLAELAQHVDTLITIPNEKLILTTDGSVSLIEAFRRADEVLFHAVKGISDLITQEGIVNVDFADVRTVMSGMGRALMGTGCAKGEGRARLAAEQAVSSPLLDDISVDGAMGVLINVVGGRDIGLHEMNEAASYIQQQAHEDAEIIFGASIDESMEDVVKVTVIATGFDMAPGDAARADRGVVKEPARWLGQPARPSAGARPGATSTMVSVPGNLSRGAHAGAAAESHALSQGAAEPALPPVLVGVSSQPARLRPAVAEAEGSVVPVRERISFPARTDRPSTVPATDRGTAPSPSVRDWDTPAFRRDPR